MSNNIIKEIEEIRLENACGESIWHWLSNYVFDLTTYDGELDELFCKKIIEVCKVILDRKNFEYIKDKENYINYILVCQILEKHGWINWGTSIRGAWFEDLDEEDSGKTLCGYSYSKYNEKTHKWEHKEKNIYFTKDNLRELIDYYDKCKVVEKLLQEYNFLTEEQVKTYIEQAKNIYSNIAKEMRIDTSADEFEGSWWIYEASKEIIEKALEENAKKF